MSSLRMMRLAISMIGLMLLSSILPGCVQTDDEEDNPLAEPDVESAPIEAMGGWWPTVDGIIHDQMILGPVEWTDSALEEVTFTDEAGNPHMADLRYKTVEEGLALGVRFEGVKMNETPAEVIVTLLDRTLTSEVDTTGLFFQSAVDFDCARFWMDCPTAEPNFALNEGQGLIAEYIDFYGLNEIATLHDLSSQRLEMEATMKQVFISSFTTSFTIQIVFNEETWTYDRTLAFDWILPLLFPRTDISVEGIEVTQAVQTADMQMRLVEGKTTLARVYVDSGSFTTADVEVTLRFCLFFFCIDSLTKDHVAVQNPDRTNFAHSANFILPDHWVTYEDLDDPIPILLIATIKPTYPGGAIGYLDTDHSNNRETAVVWFNQTHDLVIWAAPIPQDTDGDGVTETRSFATITAWMNDVEAMLPTANLIQVNIDPASVNDGTRILTDGDGGAGWLSGFEGRRQTTVAQLDALAADGEPLPMPYPDQVHGITPGLGSGGGLADGAFWGGNSFSSWCGNSVQDYGGVNPVGSTCVAHEITHNMGPILWDQDVPADGVNNGEWDERWGKHLEICTADGGTNAWNVRYTIQDVGWDPLSPNPETNSAALYASQYPGYMGYCRATTGATNTAVSGGGWTVPAFSRLPQWIPTYAWDEYYDKFTNWAPGQPNWPANGREAQNHSIRMVSGVISLDGRTASLGHSWAAAGLATAQTRGYDLDTVRAEYAVITRDGSGNEIEEIGFHPSFENSDHQPTDYHFNFLIQDDAKEIQSVELIRNGSIVDYLYSSGSPITRMLPIGQSELSRDRQANLSWVRATTTSNREVHYQLEYSWGTGLWLPIGAMTNQTNTLVEMGTLPGSDDVRFRVRATNGFDTYTAESPSLNLPDQPPVLKLESGGAVGLAQMDGKTPTVTQGESFSFTTIITDADFDSISRNGCSAVLKRGGEVVWGHDDSRWSAPNRIASERDAGMASCGGVGNSQSAGIYSFPNAGILSGEMLPGDYVFEMTYTDVKGVSVTEAIEFTIILKYDDIDLRIVESLRQSMVQIDKAIERIDSIDEMRYYYELQRAARGDEDALSDAELTDLRLLLEIETSRAKELEDEAGHNPDGQRN